MKAPSSSRPLLIADLLGCVRTVIDGDRVRVQLCAPDGRWETHYTVGLNNPEQVQAFQDAVDQFARRTVDQTAVVLGYRSQVVQTLIAPAEPLSPLNGMAARLDAMAERIGAGAPANEALPAISSAEDGRGNRR